MPFWILIFLILFTSCRTHHEVEVYDTPKVALASSVEEMEGDPAFEYNSDWLPANWWDIFEDDQLANLIEITLDNNPSFQIAYENIHLAKTYAESARSTLFPQVSWMGDISRQKLSKTGLIPFNTNPLPISQPPIVAPGGFDGIPVYFTQFETEAFLSYDFDLWGKNRKTLAAAIGEVKSKQADYAFTRLELSVAVAKVYYQLQISYKREEIAEALVKSQTNSGDLTGQRLSRNIDPQETLLTSRANLDSFAQQLKLVEGDSKVFEYRLKAYLASDFMENFCNIDIANRPIPKAPLPAELPLHLIAHRPDIISQLWLIKSAGKLIDVAKAGFYPDFNLAALFGYQTLHLHKLFEWPSSFFNVDPAFSLPIFDGGLLRANLYGSVVRYDLAILKYNQLVINAARDVLEAITLVKSFDEQLTELQKRTARKEEVYRLTVLRMENNISSQVDVYAAEQDWLLAKDLEILGLGNKIQAILSLVKALGGGYESCYEDG